MQHEMTNLVSEGKAIPAGATLIDPSINRYTHPVGCKEAIDLKYFMESGERNDIQLKLKLDYLFDRDRV
jgi:hypothetical protein